MIKELHKYVNTSHVLCIQWDAFVLNHNKWNPSFLEYDYIGAPWWFQDQNNVGNGGFSLRSKKLLQSTSSLNIKNYHPEDVVICRTYKELLKKENIAFAPEYIASQFSFEGNQKYGHKWNGNTFGFHDLEMSDISNWKGYKDFLNGTY